MKLTQIGKWIRRGLLFIVLICAAVLLHYYLPSRDIVQIVGTDVKRIDIDKGSPFWDRPDTGTNVETTRDVRFINTVRANGKARVYRNEDTGWSFPFYFKFDSGDLNAKAQTIARAPDEQWVAVSHYGWRIKLFSIFPNAYKIKPVSGPNVRLIPWFNIAFLLTLAFIGFAIWRAVRRWRKKNITPHTDKIRDELEDAAQAVNAQKDKIETELTQTKTRYKGFMKRWFGSQ